MTNKSILIRRKWEAKNRGKYRLQYKARHRANEVYTVAQKCSLDDCDGQGERHHPDYNKPEIIVWLCRKHHRQIHRKRDPICIYKDCGRTHHARGYCTIHYNRMKRGKL